MKKQGNDFYLELDPTPKLKKIENQEYLHTHMVKAVAAAAVAEVAFMQLIYDLLHHSIN